MTSPKALVAALCLAGAVLAGCDLGHPGGYVARSNSYCNQTSTQLAKLDVPETAKEQLGYAIDRYTLIERLVSEMIESSLPSGDEGRQLRDRWLTPARLSLTDGHDALTRLRVAVESADRPAADAAFAQARLLGTTDVDVGLLRARGLTRCATLFETAAP